MGKIQKIKIGLYKHRETGEYDVMINQKDNTFVCHNGEFELVNEFEHLVKNEIKDFKVVIETDVKGISLNDAINNIKDKINFKHKIKEITKYHNTIDEDSKS